MRERERERERENNKWVMSDENILSNENSNENQTRRYLYWWGIQFFSNDTGGSTCYSGWSHDHPELIFFFFLIP